MLPLCLQMASNPSAVVTIRRIRLFGVSQTAVGSATAAAMEATDT